MHLNSNIDLLVSVANSSFKNFVRLFACYNAFGAAAVVTGYSGGILYDSIRLLVRERVGGDTSALQSNEKLRHATIQKGYATISSFP